MTLALLQVAPRAPYFPRPGDIPPGLSNHGVVPFFSSGDFDSIVQEVLNRPKNDNTRERDLHALFRRESGLSEEQRAAVRADLPADRRGAYAYHLDLVNINEASDMGPQFALENWARAVSRIKDERERSYAIRSVPASYVSADPTYRYPGRIYNDLLTTASKIADPQLRDLTLKHLKSNEQV
jgi:hypothetical protein